MNVRQYEILTEIGRYQRNKIQRERGHLDYKDLVQALHDAITKAALEAELPAADYQITSIVSHIATFPPEPSALDGLLSTLDKAKRDRAATEALRDADARKTYHALSVTDVVNDSDLMVTLRMPRSAWEELHRQARAELPKPPKPVVKQKASELFPNVLDFSGKKR